MGDTVDSDFYLIECHKCNLKLVYTFYNMKEEKKDDKMLLNFHKHCLRCETEDILDVLNKKKFLVGEIFEKFYQSFLSRYYTDINQLDTLCLGFKNHENDIFKNYSGLLKVDPVKYSIYLQSKHKEHIQKLTEESLVSYKLFIKTILDFLATQFDKIAETEKMISECESCKKEEADGNKKVSVCASCKNKINN